MTLSAATAFNGSGSATRTLKLGNGTWTISDTSTNGNILWNMGTTTGLTFDAGLSVLSFTGDAAIVGGNTVTRLFSGGGLTYSTVQVSAQSKQGRFQLSGANTIASLTVAGRNDIVLAATQTITTLSLNGTSTGLINVGSSTEGTARTLSVASNPPTMSYCAIRDINFSGGASFVANNSFDMGHNSGITINGPAAGGGLLANPGLGGGMAA